MYGRETLAPLAGSTVDGMRPRPLAGLRLLAVDDDPDTLEVVCLTLQMAGAEVECVTDAAGALSLLRSAEPPFDALIADYRLHGEQDGVWLIRQVRALEGRLARIPALSYTAETGFVAHGDLEEAGYDVRITKAVAPVELVGHVLRLTARRPT